AQRGPTAAVYLISPGQWLAHDDAPCKVDFWLRNLQRLNSALGELNIPLLIRHADTWDQAPEVLAGLCQELSVESVHVNDEYGIHEERRDAAVAKALEAQGITFHTYLDQLFFQPGSVLTKTGTYFQVFSQFRKVCYSRLHGALPRLVATPKAQAPLTLKSDEVPDHVEGFATPSEALRALWPAGEAEARRRLDQFADAQISYYKDERDFPAKPGTSQLSAYLAAGVVSPRQCLHAALQSNQGEFESGDIGAITWINELLWREFYKHILVGYPRVSRHRAFRPETEAVAWRNSPEDLKAWQEARTGLPIIDAAMRQLLETGWMHNRLRMVAASYLTKHLRLHWRHGARWFWDTLVDADLANNTMGWQWVAGTGADAAPYFRVFNPVTQAEKFDPQARYISRWVPELAALPVKARFAPWQHPLLLAAHAPGYPRTPLVDLAAGRDAALAAYRQSGAG
ncbi:MAG: cryptochrome/photolyase family protein, partial [Pseudomonas sp.]